MARSPQTNRQVKLIRRPVGPFQRADFAIDDAPLTEPMDGEVRVKIDYVSLDPAMRGWATDANSYMPPVPLGAVMRGYAAGTVDVSRAPDFKPGDPVTGVLGIQRYAVAEARHLQRADLSIAHLPSWIGGLGMTGLTAYFGVEEVLQPKAGETVVVTAASGAVGSLVGQMVKHAGARVVGVAGGPDKCRHLTERLGFDAAVDYKAGRLAEDLAAACPKGIDADFENVGGEVLDAILPLMNTFGRIAICGLISGFGHVAPPPGTRNIRCVLTQRLKMQGMIVGDWRQRFPEARQTLAQWVGAGKLALTEDIRQDGIDAFPDVLNLLYTGGNFGKLLLKV